MSSLLRIWRADRGEIAARSVAATLFVGPILFVTVETSPTAWAIIAALCGAAYLSTGSPRPSRGLVSLAAILCFVAGFTAASGFWAVNPDRIYPATRDAFGYSFAVLILILCIETFSRLQRQRALDLLIVGVWIAVPALLAKELYLGALTPSAVVNNITLHKITLYGAIFAAFLLAQKDVVSWALACFFGIVTLVCGRSAGADIAIAVVALFAVLSAKTRQRVLVWVTACYIAVASVAPLLARPAFAFLDSNSLLSFYPGTYAARLELWAEISSHIHKAPLLGHGADTMRNALGVPTRGKYFDNGALLPSAHNIVFDLWFEFGAFGIAIYAALLTALVRLIARLRGSSHFLTSSCLIVIVIALSVDHRIWLSWVLGTLVMATTMCVLWYLESPS